MRHMTLAFGFVLLAVLVLLNSPVVSVADPSDSVNRLTPAELADGWLLLFDGETLFGWKPVSEADWKVDGGAITVTAGKPGLLRTTSQWGNYVLKADFRVAAETEGAVYLRTPPVVTDPKNRAYGVRLAGAKVTDAEPTGSLVARKKAETSPTSDEWHQLEITAGGPKILVSVDGKTVVDYDDPAPMGRGYIGLAFEKGPIAFRNIKLKPLGMKPIFTGKDLSGWKTYPEMASVFTVTEKGEMNVKNGRGQIETEGAYGDFTLQLEVFVNGEKLNSGVFFRCIPGDTMNGYESQIHNGFKGDDRNRPADCGTGGIFRRTNARRITANDFEWFRKTIHADGPHIAVWVNGYQVTDWTDRRKPNENPRRGLRLEPGTIQIQGHDPTTDISLRNIRISEIPARFSKSGQ